jgi:hypothetical protein
MTLREALQKAGQILDEERGLTNRVLRSPRQYAVGHSGNITNLISQLQSIGGHDVAPYVVGQCQVHSALLALRHM